MNETASSDGFFRPWHLVALFWFSMLGMELGSEAWMSWDWPKSAIKGGLLAGLAVGLGFTFLTRRAFPPDRPSWVLLCVLSFLSVPVLAAGAELLRGDQEGGTGTLLWGVPIAVALGVVVGLIGDRVRARR